MNKATKLSLTVPGFVALAPRSAAGRAGLTAPKGTEVAWLRRDELWLVGVVDPATSEVLATGTAPASSWMTYGRDNCGRTIKGRYYADTCILAPHPADLPCRATTV